MLNKGMLELTDIDNAYDQEASIKDYLSLLKPRVMSLVVFTSFAGMLVAPGFNSTHPLIIFVAIFSIALGAGASGAINMWYEKELDSKMKRTRMRPLPQGKVHPDDAIAYALLLSFISVTMLGLSTNWLAAGLLAITSIYYVLIYTVWLKPRTPQNIVIGGAAGAFPPVIGWAAIAGELSLFPILLFIIIFIWTPPHFWALSLFANDDYKSANIPMMTVTAGERSTKNQMLLYTLLLLPISASPYFLGYTGLFYGLTALLLGLFFVYTAIKVKAEEENKYKFAKLMFGYSVFYLFALFLGLMIDAI
jgi:protoheme IX farnesyltransferase